MDKDMVGHSGGRKRVVSIYSAGGMANTWVETSGVCASGKSKRWCNLETGLGSFGVVILSGWDKSDREGKNLADGKAKPSSLVPAP